jgi:hypothetical protein
MHQDIEKALPEFKDLEGVALERIRKEFISGLTSKDVDPKCFLSIYDRTGYIDKVFPGVQLNFNVPPQLRDKEDKILALAWILQDNPSHKIAEVLSPKRGEKPTGWPTQERDAVVFLTNLKYFDPEKLDTFLKHRTVSGITKKQIRQWVDLFDVTREGRVKSLMGPRWQQDIKKFSQWDPDPSELVQWMEKNPCPECEGEGCSHCDYKGFHKSGVHPEIIRRGKQMVSPESRSGVVQSINRELLKKQFEKFAP